MIWTITFKCQLKLILASADWAGTDRHYGTQVKSLKKALDEITDVGNLIIFGQIISNVSKNSKSRLQISYLKNNADNIIGSDKQTVHSLFAK